MSVISFFCFLLIQIAAGLITGLTSFGGALFAIPLMALFLPIQHAIVIVCVSFGIVSLLMIYIYRKHLLWGEILRLGIAGVLGAPIGTWFLAHADIGFLLVASGSTIALFLFWQWLAPRISRKARLIPTWYACPCGFLAGFMSGSVGMGGPPIVIYTYMRQWSKDSAIGGIAAVFGILLIIVIYGQWQEGLLTLEVLKLSLWAALGTALGLLLSVPLVKRINVGIFRGLVLIMLALSSLTLIIKGIMS